MDRKVVYKEDTWKSMWKNKKVIIPIILIIGFLTFLKLVDLGYKSESSNYVKNELVDSCNMMIDSGSIKYDSLFYSIDQGLNKIIKERNAGKITSEEIAKLKQTIKVSKPFIEKPVSDVTTNDKGEVTFYLITKPGLIANKWGAVQYYLPGNDEKYYYEITLKKGLYSFQTISQPRDSVTFVVDNGGAYKLGFQEIHPYFIVFKDSIK